MTASITYSEVQGLISKTFKIRPDMSMINERTICVAYKPGFLIPTVKVDICVEAIQNESILLSYHCQSALALMVKGVISLLREKIPAQMIDIDTDKRSIVVHLNEIEQIRSVLSYMSLENIYIDNCNVYIDLQLK